MELRRALRIVKYDIIAFVGAGGKTTAMFRLAGELAAADCRAILTTTTHIFAPTGGQPPVVAEDEPALLRQVRERLQDDRLVVVARSHVDAPEGAKLAGVRPEFVLALRDHTQVDVILVEADGSRGRPLKAPAAHEPVIPPSATLVIPVAGLSAIGRKFSPESVHRPDRVAALTGLASGEAITAQTLAAVLMHPEGGLKSVPQAARVVALLNQADNSARLSAGREVSALLLGEPRFEAACIARLLGDNSPPVREVYDRVAAVILAAGAGRRFGGLKQLALWRGRPLLAHVIEAVLASQVEEVVLVAGYEAERVTAFVRANWPDLRIANNLRWSEGQSTSVHAGLRALSAQVGAALFVLADQPRLSAEVINALLQRRRETFAPIVAPAYAGLRGNPVLFDRDLFPELLATTGDVGGRALIEKYRQQVAWAAFGAEAAPGDIDSPEDLLRP